MEYYLQEVNLFQIWSDALHRKNVKVGGLHCSRVEWGKWRQLGNHSAVQCVPGRTFQSPGAAASVPGAQQRGSGLVGLGVPVFWVPASLLFLFAAWLPHGSTLCPCLALVVSALWFLPCSQSSAAALPCHYFFSHLLHPCQFF